MALCCDLLCFCCVVFNGPVNNIFAVCCTCAIGWWIYRNIRCQLLHIYTHVYVYIYSYIYRLRCIVIYLYRYLQLYDPSIYLHRYIHILLCKKYQYIYYTSLLLIDHDARAVLTAQWKYSFVLYIVPGHQYNVHGLTYSLNQWMRISWTNRLVLVQEVLLATY